MNNQELFTSEELKENEERKRELIELVASGEAVLIVGAGSSARVDYPTWPSLLEKLEQLAENCGNGFQPDKEKRDSDRLAYAEYLQSFLHDEQQEERRYNALIYDLFKAKSLAVDDFHKTLVSLPFRGILTTNYDTVLEAALGAIENSSASDNSLIIDPDSAGRVDEFLRGMTDKTLTRRIAHLHGKYDFPKSIILSRKDYQRAYGLRGYSEQSESKGYQKDSDFKVRGVNQAWNMKEWTLHRKLLWAVLATRRAVFVGFSMRDPYLNEMLNAVSNDLWTWNKSIHYTIVGSSTKSTDTERLANLKRNYGVDTVFYDDADDSHEGLHLIINEIAEECGVEIPSTIMSQGVLGDNECSKHECLRSDEPKAQDVLDSLEQVNERMRRRIVNAN